MSGCCPLRWLKCKIWRKGGQAVWTHLPDTSSPHPTHPCTRLPPQGNVRSAPYGRQKPADEASSPEAALAAALLDPLGAAGPGALAAGAPDPMAHPGALAPAGPPGAAAAVQELLLAGRRLEALRWGGKGGRLLVCALWGWRPALCGGCVHEGW